MTIAILKILLTGISILAGVLLGIVLLFVFVPVRYRMKGTYTEKTPDIRFQASWLLGAASFSASVGRDFSADAYMRIFCFRVWKTAGSVSLAQPARETVAASETAADSSKITKPEPHAEGIFGNLQKFIGKLNKVYINLSDPEYNDAKAVLCTETLRILRELSPRRGYCDILLGMSDPGTLARILEAFVMLSPVLGERVRLQPDFEEEVLAVDALMSGRARIPVVLFAVGRVFCTGKLRKLYRRLRLSVA